MKLIFKTCPVGGWEGVENELNDISSFNRVLVEGELGNIFVLSNLPEYEYWTRLGFQYQTPLKSYPLAHDPWPMTLDPWSLTHAPWPPTLIPYHLSLPLVPHPLVQLGLCVGLGGWWRSGVKVECAPAAQQENAPAASASLSVWLESYFWEDCCWVVLVSGEVMTEVVGWLWRGLWSTRKSGEI